MEVLLDVLEKAISPNTLERQQAKDFLKDKIKNAYAALGLALSTIMLNQGVAVVIRIQAAWKLSCIVHKRRDRWKQVPAEIRAEIKAHCLHALATQDPSRHTAAECVAKVACVELPGGHWPDVMALLVANITGGVSTEALKQASLEAIGYICNKLRDPTIVNLQHIIDGILQSLVRPIVSKVVGVAAARALLQVLIAMRHILKDEGRRGEVLKSVIDVAQDTDEDIACEALQCLTRIMSDNYGKVDESVIENFHHITTRSMQSQLNSMVLQGIEFWLAVCREEIKTRNKNFLPKLSAKFLVPLLLEILERHKAGDDLNEWNLNKAAFSCLRLLSQTCEEAYVEVVLPYVQQSIRHADWRKRDVALMAFGSILEGPSRTRWSRSSRGSCP